MSIQTIIFRELIRMNPMNNQKRIEYLSKKKVIKKFKNKNIYSQGAYLLNNFIVAKKLKTDLNGFTFWKNEINSLMRVKNSKYFPQIVAADPINMIIYMTYCGNSLEELKQLPNNWLEQLNDIKDLLIKRQINPNDILSRNICILDGNIKIIDFGLANTRHNEIIKSIKKLETILRFYNSS